MATWATVLADIRSELEEPTAGIWTDALLLTWFNEAQNDFSRRTRILSDEQYALGTSGQQSYEIPDNTIEIRSVHWDDDALAPAEYSSFATLTASGTPTMFALWGGITGEDDGLYLYPIPNESKVITVLRYYMPADITAGTDTIPFDNRDTQSLKSYVKMRATEMVTDMDSAAWFRDNYERAVSEREFQMIRYENFGTRVPTEVW